jgi:hypothetical protein
VPFPSLILGIRVPLWESSWGLAHLCPPSRLCREGIGGPPFAVFERWESMLRAAGVRALRGAEAPLFHGARVLLVLREVQNQRQRRRTGVSDPHWQFRVPEDSHRFIFFDVQVTLLPVLGWGYWSRGRCRSFGGGGETKVPHFVRDDRHFVLNDRNFVRDDRNFVRNDRVRGRRGPSLRSG